MDLSYPTRNVDRRKLISAARNSRITTNDPQLSNHFHAPSISLASKYLICAMVKGLHTFDIHSSHFFSPTRAMRSIFVQCVVENLMSSHNALASQPWKS